MLQALIRVLFVIKSLSQSNTMYVSEYFLICLQKTGFKSCVTIIMYSYLAAIITV